MQPKASNPPENGSRFVQSGSQSRHNEVVSAFLLEGDASLLARAFNEKDVTREARWKALSKHLAGVFGSFERSEKNPIRFTRLKTFTVKAFSFYQLPQVRSF